MSFDLGAWLVLKAMQADLFAAMGIGMNALGIAPAPAPIQEAPAFAPALSAALEVDIVRPGTGPIAQTGDRVTVHFIVRTAEGKELANTLKRGMPYSIELSNPGSFWNSSVEGLRVGGAARFSANSSLFFGKAGVLPVVPPDTPLIAYVTLLKVEKAVEARKPDSAAKSGQR